MQGGCVGGQVNASALYVARICEECGGKFRQQYGRGRPKKYCDQDCADTAKNIRRSPKATRFPSKEAFWAWQRTPERRAEIGRKVAATKRASRGVINQVNRIFDVIEGT